TSGRDGGLDASRDDHGDGRLHAPRTGPWLDHDRPPRGYLQPWVYALLPLDRPSALPGRDDDGVLAATSGSSHSLPMLGTERSAIGRGWDLPTDGGQEAGGSISFDGRGRSRAGGPRAGAGASTDATGQTRRRSARNVNPYRGYRSRES